MVPEKVLFHKSSIVSYLRAMQLKINSDDDPRRIYLFDCWVAILSVIGPVDSADKEQILKLIYFGFGSNSNKSKGSNGSQSSDNSESLVTSYELLLKAIHLAEALGRQIFI